MKNPSRLAAAEKAAAEKLVPWPGTVSTAWRAWLRALGRRLRRATERPPRRLRLAESVGLGDRRFIALVELDGRRFLLGATSQSVVLLAELDAAGDGGAAKAGEEAN